MKELIEKLQRDTETHKGENGRVGVIAGSRDYTGAPALSASSALRTGCDLATIYTSNSVSETVSSYSENFIVQDYSSDYFDMEVLEKALELDRNLDALVIGPGLSDPEPESIRKFIEKCSSPVVIDADAIKHVEADFVKNAVLTPRRAEFEEVKDSLESVLDRGNVVVKKGPSDIIYSKTEEKEIDVGHPTMTVGGTGDVLTGIIASLISQGLEIEDAAKLGTWVNGKAGERAANEYGLGALPTDIVEEIPQVLKSET